MSTLDFSRVDKIVNRGEEMVQIIKDISCVDLSGNFITCPKIDYSQVCRSFDLSGVNTNPFKGFDLSGVVSDWANSDISLKDLMNYKYQPLITFFIAFGLVVFYFIVGVFYYEGVHVGLYNLYKNQHADWNTFNKSLSIYRFILFVIIFILLLVFLYIFVYYFILKGSKKSTALSIISVSLLSIVGLTFLIIHNTTFVKIFENTIGYGIVNSIWGEELNDKLKQIFSHQFFKNDVVNKPIPDTNFSFKFLFSLLQLHNFKEMLNVIGNGETGVIQTPNVEQATKDECEKYIFNCVVLKNTVGHLCWVYFASLTATLVSIRYLSKNL